VDVELGHEFGADIGSNAVEGFEGAGDELLLWEVDAEDEDLSMLAPDTLRDPEIANTMIASD